MKYKVEMEVTGTVTKIVEANSEDETREFAYENYSGRNITLCCSCSDKVSGLVIDENYDEYEVEEI